MKKLILPLFALTTLAANSQFSIQPQMGMEALKTSIRSDDFSSFSPKGMQFAPRIALRAEYKARTGHGAYVGVATGNPAVAFTFTDPYAAQTSYTAVSKGVQFRLEGGYQFTTKRIALSKPSSSGKSAGHRYGGGEQRKCGGQMRCASRSSSGGYAKSSYRSKEKDNGMYMRIKPSVGLALVPLAKGGIETQTKAGQTNYTYNAGLNTAVVAGTALEFGSRNQSRFVVNLSYVKGLGNNEQTLTTGSAVKPIVSKYQSNTSGFIVSMGFPISLKKKPAVSQKKQCNWSKYSGGCKRYKI